ncbi:MAG: lipopolysaccharide biosynthesis protein [Phycisphaerae bacterium]
MTHEPAATTAAGDAAGPAHPSPGASDAAAPTRRAGRSLRKNVGFALVGTGVFNACRFGVAVLLAKFATPAILGQYNYSLALVSPVVLFCQMHLRATLVSDARGDFTFGTYSKLRQIGMSLAALVVLLIAGVVSWSESRIAFVAILAFVGVEKIWSSTSELAWAMYQKRERVDLVARANILQGVAMLTPFAVFVPLYAWLVRSGTLAAERLADGAAFAVASYAIGYFLIYWLHDRPQVTNQPDCDPRWDWAGVQRLAVQVFPLGLILMIINLCETVPRAILKHESDGEQALGYFGALTYITLAANLLLIQVGIAASNRLALYHHTNFPAFVRLTVKLVIMTAAVAGGTYLATWLFGEWLLRVLYRPDYAAYHREFMILVFGQCVSMLASMFGIVTFQMRRFWMQFAIHVAVLATSIIAALVLIPGNPRPVEGAAWSVVIRNVVHTALYGVALFWGIRDRSRAIDAAPPPAAG